MTRWHGGLLLGAAGFEALAALAAARGADASAIALHACSSACAAGGLRPGLPGARGAWSFAFPFACSLFVPVLGALGLAAVAAVPPRRAAAEPTGTSFTQTPIPAPPSPGPSSHPTRPRQPGGRDTQLAAVTAVRHRDDPTSVALLRRALKDRDEEVRLLAFALLEQKAGAIYGRIQEDSRELETATGARLGVLHGRLAFSRWELVWLGLVQGEVSSHELRLASEHARAALEQDPRSASLHLLLGRIRLRLGRPGEAREAFLRAGELGLPAKLVGPYLAEVAFLERRFDLVRDHLASASGSRGGGAIARAKRYWA